MSLFQDVLGLLVLSGRQKLSERVGAAVVKRPTGGRKGANVMAMKMTDAKERRLRLQSEAHVAQYTCLSQGDEEVAARAGQFFFRTSHDDSTLIDKKLFYPQTFSSRTSTSCS